MFPVRRTYGGKKFSVTIAVDPPASNPKPDGPKASSAISGNDPTGPERRGLGGVSSRTPLRRLENVQDGGSPDAGMKKPCSTATSDNAMSICQTGKSSGTTTRKGKRAPPGTPESTPSSAKTRVFSPSVSVTLGTVDHVSRRLSTAYSSFSSATPRLSTASSCSSLSSAPTTVSRASSSSSSSSVMKATPLPRAFLRADAEDLSYLHEMVVGNRGPRPFMGFGKGFVFFPPEDWEPARRMRLREFCQTIGFEAKTQAGKVYLQLENKKAAKLKRDLTAWRASLPMGGSALLPRPSMCGSVAVMDEEAEGNISVEMLDHSTAAPPPQADKDERDAKEKTRALAMGGAAKQGGPRLSDVLTSLGNLVIKEGDEDAEDAEEREDVFDFPLSPVPHAPEEEEEEEEEGEGGRRHSSHSLLSSPCFSEGSGGDPDHSFVIRKRQSDGARRRSSTSPHHATGRSRSPPPRCLSRTPPRSPLSGGSPVPGSAHSHSSRDGRLSLPHAHPPTRLSTSSTGGGGSSSSSSSSSSKQRTFETPSSAKQADWVLSQRANSASIGRLRLRFQKEEETFELQAGQRTSLGLLPSPHLRYSLPSPPHAPSSLLEERRAMERSRRSRALVRRLSMGLSSRPRYSLSRALSTLAIVDEPGQDDDSAMMLESSFSDPHDTTTSGGPANEQGEDPPLPSKPLSRRSSLPPSSLPSAAVHRLGALTVSCLEFLALPDLPPSLCRAWAAGCYPLQAQARMIADIEKGAARHPELFADHRALAGLFPCGQFLSDGAYKAVYRVWCTRSGRVEAVSVMDVQAITSTGNLAVVSQELHASILVAGLVRRHVCPNVVETYGVLRSVQDPNHSGMWACDDESFLLRRTAAGRPKADNPRRGPKPGDYQLIRMELCRHGDLEGFLRRQPDGLVPADVALQLTFQMCFSLYAVRQSFAMRHYDVKLLNFLVTDFKQGAAPASSVRYGLGHHVYRLRLLPPWNLCVKLADFGTADVCAASLGGHMGLERFTTLENTPPEFLSDGDHVKLGYGVDTFPLGLAMLHLFTGAVPYEEWMGDVLCPGDLRDALSKVWKGREEYSILASLLQSCEDEDVEEGGDSAGTLYHTFYRYLVLLGLPTGEGEAGERRRQNPVWKAVHALIHPHDGMEGTDAPGNAAKPTTRGRGACKRPKLSKKASKVTSQYLADASLYSLAVGTQPLIARARARLEALPGAFALLRQFMAFDPLERCSMHDAMGSRAFEHLREGEQEAAHAPTHHEDGALSFLAYWTQGREGQSKWPKGIPEGV